MRSPNVPPKSHPPLPMSDGSLIAAYTTNKNFEAPMPNQPTLDSTFDFRLYTMGSDTNPNNAGLGYLAHNQLLTGGLGGHQGVPTKTFSYYDGSTLISRTNRQLWEIQPVEVVART